MSLISVYLKKVKPENIVIVSNITFVAMTLLDYLKINNGIYERFHKTIVKEFYQITFMKKSYNNGAIAKISGRMNGIL